MADTLKIFASHCFKGIGGEAVVYGLVWSRDAESVERVTVELPEGFRMRWDEKGFPLIQDPSGAPIHSAYEAINCAVYPDSPPIMGWFVPSDRPWRQSHRDEYDLKVVAREPFPFHGDD